MTQFDVCLIGNLIVDDIYCVSNFILGHSNKSLSHERNVGSIANVLRVLMNLRPDFKISICSSIGKDVNGKNVMDWVSKIQYENQEIQVNLHHSDQLDTSNALIISDVTQNTRSSIVNWGACAEMRDFTAPPSEWFHIMYADKLHNLNIENLKELKKQGVVSVDFCLGSHSKKEIERITSLLPYIDYAILSVDEVCSIAQSKQAIPATKKIGKLINKYAIIHSPCQVYISNGESLDILETNYVDKKNMNVLGAGDMFAAAVIVKKLERLDTIQSATFAHHYTTKKLMESYEKEI